MARNTLSVTDNRTRKEYEIPVTDGSIRTLDLRQIKVSDDDFGVMGYDPAFSNTACCRSTITEIDGEKGILRYCGYPIEQLAEECTHLEVAYLLLFGELPTNTQYREWTRTIAQHAMLPEKAAGLIGAFARGAHPMAMTASTVAALSAFYPEAGKVHDQETRRLQIVRLIAKMPTVGANIYCHTAGLSYADPDSKLSYAANFLNMTLGKTGSKYMSDPVMEKALDVLFILHADHEQNCSANAMRSVGSSLVDPYSAAAAAVAALSGPLHGGANEAVLHMLRQIESRDRVPEYIKRVKAGEIRLMGFGHRIYKNYDPRARIIKRMADEVFEVTGTNPLLDVALELEKIALQDEYFVKRKLYPNVDFYSGLIYEAMGFPSRMFTVLFSIARTSGWLAQWEEMLLDSEQKIARPRQIYGGPARRDLPRRPQPAGKGSEELGGDALAERQDQEAKK